LPVLGKGTVRDLLFGGATQRIRFELDDLRGTQSIGLSLEYGQQGALVDAVQSTLDPVYPDIGEERWLALRRYHVLQPSSLRILTRLELGADNSSPVSTASALVGASHGLLSLLTVASSPDEDTEATRELAKAADMVRTARRDQKLATKVRCGDPVLETVLEAQEGYFDMVVLSRRGGEEEGPALFSDSARHMLANARIPVLIVSDQPSSLKRALICTAGGEPGKGDVRFAARLARHTGAFARVFHVRRPDTPESDIDRAQRHVQRAQNVLTSFGVENDMLIEQGDPIEVFMRQLAQGWDLVVVGAPGRSLLLDKDKPTFNTEILKRSTVPVLIVPTQD
jgi:nucleotide-binding universal stress UspA family protein